MKTIYQQSEYDAISQKGYALGFVAAHEALVKIYKAKAGEAFALGQRQAADLLIFTSHAEAFPRTVAEYMALGKPILAADVSGVNEMIKDNENGYLFNSLDPDSLVEAFRKIESSELERIRLSKNASNTYWSKFSKSNHINRALEIFKIINND